MVDKLPALAPTNEPLSDDEFLGPFLSQLEVLANKVPRSCRNDKYSK